MSTVPDYDFSTPEATLASYLAGCPGVHCDREGLARLLGELPHPLFGAAAHALEQSGAGKRSLPFLSVLHFDPEAYSEQQTTGDCVSHGTRNACDLSRAVEIHVAHEREGWHHRGATEGIYGSRGYGGQGMSCSTAARFVNSAGGLLLRQNYAELGVDLSHYNAKIGTRWGARGGVPEGVVSEARQHQVKTASLVTTVEEARDALANGYGLACCSDIGFSERRDEEGFARPSGAWSHCMAWIACDDEARRPGFLVQNSWGEWNHGPTRHQQPAGSFWIDFDVAARMLRARGTFAFSHVDGFPPVDLPDYDYLLI